MILKREGISFLEFWPGNLIEVFDVFLNHSLGSSCKI